MEKRGRRREGVEEEKEGRKRRRKEERREGGEREGGLASGRGEGKGGAERREGAEKKVGNHHMLRQLSRFAEVPDVALSTWTRMVSVPLTAFAAHRAPSCDAYIYHFLYSIIIRARFTLYKSKFQQ